MRALIKGPAPANVSPPTQQPATLAEWDADYRASVATAADPIRHARSRFDDMHKRFLRDVLFVEQRFVCVYCERQIDEVHPPPPIDHWNPLSLFLQQVFDWNNLHLSCRTVDTCDDRKKSEALNLPWPVHFQYEQVVGFTSGGRMYVRADVTIAPQVRQALAVALDDQPGPPSIRSTLNLNQPALREARAAAIEAEEAVVEGQPPMPVAQRQQRALALLSQQRRDDFVSARVAYLQGQLGVGR